MHSAIRPYSVFLLQAVVIISRLLLSNYLSELFQTLSMTLPHFRRKHLPPSKISLMPANWQPYVAVDVDVDVDVKLGKLSLKGERKATNQKLQGKQIEISCIKLVGKYNLIYNILNIL